MAKSSIYPNGDIRSKIFEHRAKKIDWEAIYETVSYMAKFYNDRNLEDKSQEYKESLVLFKRTGLNYFIRISTELLGEKNGYLISAAAYEAAQYDREKNCRKLDWRKNGPHYAEHLIPLGQFVNDVIANPDIKNIKTLYKKQKIVIVLREEEKPKYDKGSFRTNRTDKDIKWFMNKFNIRPLKDFENSDKSRKTQAGENNGIKNEYYAVLTANNSVLCTQGPGICCDKWKARPWSV